MTDSTHWGSGLPHICACGIYSPIRLAYMGRRGLVPHKKDPLGWTLTNAYLPSHLLQSRRGPPPLQGKYVVCIHFFGGGGKSLFVHPSAVSLVCLPAGTANPRPFTYAWAHICMCPPFLHARTHISPTLAEKIGKFHYAVNFSPGYRTLEFELL